MREELSITLTTVFAFSIITRIRRHLMLALLILVRVLSCAEIQDCQTEDEELKYEHGDGGEVGETLVEMSQYGRKTCDRVKWSKKSKGNVRSLGTRYRSWTVRWVSRSTRMSRSALCLDLVLCHSGRQGRQLQLGLQLLKVR